MGPCHHTSWVEVSGTSTFNIHNTKRLDRLLADLADPLRQYPQFVLCVGDGSKNEAIRSMFPDAADSKGRPGGIAQLYLDPKTLNEDHPIFLVDCTSAPYQQTAKIDHNCHDNISYRTTWSRSQDVQQTIFTRLLFNFVDVICLFADDIGGLVETRALLRKWASGNASTSLRANVRPRVLVIASDPSDNDFTSGDELWGYFSDVELIRPDPHLWGMSRSGEVKYGYLRRTKVEEQLSESLSDRRQSHASFTARDIRRYFDMNVYHVSRFPSQTFDFIAYSRMDDPIPACYSECLAAFVRLAKEQKATKDSIQTMIASSVMMDAYPWSAHGFLPDDTFDTLYAAPIRESLRRELVATAMPDARKANEDEVSTYVDNIRLKVDRWARDYITGEKDSAVKFHLNTVEQLRSRLELGQFLSNACCLFCLMRRPEHVQRCKHALCDACVQRLGELDETVEYSYLLRLCKLCTKTADLRVTLKPPTAGVRLFSFDSGGARCTMIFQTLRRLQESMGEGCRLQDVADFAIGTSGGAIAMLVCIGACKWDIPESDEEFCRFLRIVFQQKRPMLDMISPMMSRLRWIVNDGKYAGKTVDSALTAAFGEEQRLFGYPRDGHSRCKAAVTATTTKDASLLVYGNYNGDRVSSNAGENILGKVLDLDLVKAKPRNALRLPPYRYPRSRVELEVSVRDVARASTAAPGYIPAYNITGDDGDEGHQDGAMRCPNPVLLGLRECGIAFGPDVKVDLILTIGAGAYASAPSENPSAYSGPWRDGFIQRLWRWGRSVAWEYTDANAVHEMMKEMMSEDLQLAYVRLNRDLGRNPPALDDVSRLGELRKHICEKDLMTTVLSIFTRLFFFELSKRPRHVSAGRYRCEGVIRLRGSLAQASSLLRSLHPGLITFATGRELQFGVNLQEVELEKDVCEECGRFNVPIVFDTAHWEEKVVITLQLFNGQSERISGFPTTMEDLVRKQRIDGRVAEYGGDERRCVCRRTQRVTGLVMRKRPSTGETPKATKMRRRNIL